MARAELILYMGLCPASIHVGEGKFIRDSASPYEKERYLKCMNVVLQTLDEIKMIVPSIYNDIYVYGTYLIREGSNAPLAYIQYCDKGVLRDEKKAIVLTEFVEKNIRGARGLIELISDSHGMIRFYRKLEFEGVEESSKHGLIAKLKKSGIKMEESHWDWDSSFKFF